MELVRAFVNTLDVEGETDELETPEGLAAWLSERELMPSGEAAKPGDLERAVAVRESLRALLHSNHGEPLEPEALDALNEISAGMPLVVRFTQDGVPRLEPALGGVDEALGRLLSYVCVAMIDGTWSRLKICRNDECQWAFYDLSKNRSGTWCTMAVCGSRMKTRAYRERQRARPAT